jgi:hypothetical protein
MGAILTSVCGEGFILLLLQHACGAMCVPGAGWWLSLGVTPRHAAPAEARWLQGPGSAELCMQPLDYNSQALQQSVCECLPLTCSHLKTCWLKCCCSFSFARLMQNCNSRARGHMQTGQIAAGEGAPEWLTHVHHGRQVTSCWCGKHASQ